MGSLARIYGSDKTGNAAVATVQSTRLPLATTLVVDTVENIPASFMGSMGTPHTFIDPVTSEEITVISEATAVDFAGHVDSTNLIIDTIAPGYTDAGSAVGDIVIIRPTTQWADNVADVIAAAHNDDGTIKNNAITAPAQITDGVIGNAEMATAVKPVTLMDESTFDYVSSGCIWTADAAASTRVASMTAGVVYIAGKRLTVAAVVSRTFTASKDVYVGFNDNGDGTAAVVYYDNTTNAASPSFATAGYAFLVAIVVVGVSSIAAAASINQGDPACVLPIASSIPYTVTDSLGHLINNRNPNGGRIGYRQILTSFSTATTGSDVDVTGLSVPVIIPAGRQIKITFFADSMATSSAGATVLVAKVKEGSTTLGTNTSVERTANDAWPVNAVAHPPTPSAGLHTYKASINSGNATTSVNAASNQPAFISVEIV